MNDSAPPVPSNLDIAVWPEGTCCFRDEIEERLMWMSDDYRIVPVGHADYNPLYVELTGGLE